MIEAPVEDLWAILRDFNSHALWHPAVAISQIEWNEPGDRVGAVRAFRLKNGSRIREQLLSHSDRERSFSYCVLEAAAPLRNYVAHVRLKPVTEGDSCLWQWRAAFDPPASARERLARFVCEEIMDAGFAGMRAYLRQLQSAPAAPATPATVPLTPADAVEVALTRYGGPEVLALRHAHIPAPAAGQARIRQTAVGVNFIDVYCRRGSFDLVPPGGVIGMEAAGVVESVGPNVANVRPGDRVAYACAPPGAYASMRTMRADLLVRLLDSLSDVGAAALLLKGVTASFLLHDVARVKAGSVVLVHAAAGGVGQILCRWAKALGATVIGATSSEPKAEIARKCGCDSVVVTSREDFVAALRRLTSGRGADIVFDAVGKDTFVRSRPSPRVATSSASARPQATSAPNQLIDSRAAPSPSRGQTTSTTRTRRRRSRCKAGDCLRRSAPGPSSFPARKSTRWRTPPPRMPIWRTAGRWGRSCSSRNGFKPTREADDGQTRVHGISDRGWAPRPGLVPSAEWITRFWFTKRPDRPRSGGHRGGRTL